MKLNKTSLLFAMMISSISAQALESDYDQPINVSSVSQHAQMKSNTVTFNEDVLLTQGTIKITGDKLTVIRGKKANHEIMIAEGKVATFYQLQDDGKPFDAEANTIHYDVANAKITLTGNAQVKQLDSQINGEKIIYLLETEELTVESDKAGQQRVKTVFLPAQFEKNDESKQQAEDK
ncbi:lipopolysaccharide export system protein LptA [Psychromonas marina]|uniref:Lipopolysaccharide export system protein LptA n=1 Tax=Psychromonas marina TaxID=88364 RepID=A0ABQ6E461_9GAMM|nr:lipopolysaccharide transport periplasmic protein LptA [Psychromonas marina]GLS92189.1 lipopolysaccharide export system protein LptA [Psychromonas marina]